MTTKKDADEELWQLVQEAAFDLLDPLTPMDDIGEIIRVAGGNASEIGKRGAAAAASEARKRRLGWMVDAAAKRDAMAKRTRSKVDRGGMDRPALLAELSRLRASPMGEQIQAAYRGRRPEDSSDDALRELLDDIDEVLALGNGDGDATG